MAIEDEKKLVLSRRIATVWVVIAMTASIVIGMVGLGMTRVGALEFLSGSSSETLIVCIASLISQHGVAGGSLADSSLQASWRLRCPRRTARCWPRRPACRRTFCRSSATLKLSEKQSLFAARLTIICVSVVGGAGPRPGFQRLRHRQLCVGRFRRLFGAVVLCALFWKRCNWQGRSGRYALRRPDGLRLEVHRQPAGRRLRHL